MSKEKNFTSYIPLFLDFTYYFKLFSDSLVTVILFKCYQLIIIIKLIDLYIYSACLLIGTFKDRLTVIILVTCLLMNKKEKIFLSLFMLKK